MPKNTGMGGNKRKKGKKQVQEDRELRYKEESEEYAQIIKILGDGRFQCKCTDGVERVAHVRGKMRKRTWLANGDIILVSIREFEPEKCDVVEKYKEKEVAKLKSAGEIPETMVLANSGENEEKNNEAGGIVFEDQDQDQEVKTKKKENSSGFDIESESEEENEEDEKDKEDKNEKKDNDEVEKEDKKEEKESKEDKEEREEEIQKEKEKKNKKQKKENDRKRKNNRDKKKEKGNDDGGFNIDDI
jgi:translation initiation factor 1A